MTDYIKSSQAIQGFLDKEKIEVKPDEHAPVVFEWGVINPSGDFSVCTKHYIEGPKRFVCPYFGPGGADNGLKALRAYCKKYDCYLALEDSPPDTAKWLLISEETIEVGGDYMNPPEIEPALIIDGEGKTDGIALHDLLYKIATEEK